MTILDDDDESIEAMMLLELESEPVANRVPRQSREGLISSTRNMTPDEQLGIFLYGVGHGVANRILAETFQHSEETISRHFNNVLRGIVRLKDDYIMLPSRWEGSAADMRVLRWACERGGFVVPEGKYYLVDSGYANTEKILHPIEESVTILVSLTQAHGPAFIEIHEICITTGMLN
uniref:DUF8040 domain-containing protein n=1 Tax=Ananas comosus var. bracteatus TaxID=296719 RepID=A0A6V7PY21_ANACO|nr:unnamed protein product [Ananas comosus var. bracteatus]